MFEQEEGDHEVLDSDEREAAEQHTQEQMDYYMQHHPELLLALDIAAFRRQQIQNRLHAGQESSARGQQRSEYTAQEDSAREEPSDVEDQRVDIYANIGQPAAVTRIAEN